MNAPVSIREVAAHAGVSVGTVSNVLNRPDIVAQSTRDRVQLGRTAAKLLLEETMEPDSHTHRQVMFKPELEIRQSSQAPAG